MERLVNEKVGRKQRPARGPHAHKPVVGVDGRNGEVPVRVVKPLLKGLSQCSVRRQRRYERYERVVGVAAAATATANATANVVAWHRAHV